MQEANGRRPERQAVIVIVVRNERLAKATWRLDSKQRTKRVTTKQERRHLEPDTIA